MIPKKHLGQHFLTAPYYARKIVQAVPATGRENLLEIGPGPGALSIFLKERFPDFHLVEIDDAAIEPLLIKLGTGTYTLHNNDILSFDYRTAGFPLHVVGNLPYSIGAQIIKKTLLYGNNIRSCTFMVQREVAERMAAAPGGKTYGVLSVWVQLYTKVIRVRPLGRSIFHPRPNVDSSLVLLERLPEGQLPANDPADLRAVVQAAFGQRRKTLVNALGTGLKLTRQEVDDLVRGAGLPTDVRAERLAPRHFAELAEALRKS